MIKLGTVLECSSTLAIGTVPFPIEYLSITHYSSIWLRCFFRFRFAIWNFYHSIQFRALPAHLGFNAVVLALHTFSTKLHFLYFTCWTQHCRSSWHSCNQFLLPFLLPKHKHQLFQVRSISTFHPLLRSNLSGNRFVLFGLELKRAKIYSCQCCWTRTHEHDIILDLGIFFTLSDIHLLTWLSLNLTTRWSNCIWQFFCVLNSFLLIILRSFFPTFSCTCLKCLSSRLTFLGWKLQWCRVYKYIYGQWFLLSK